MQFSVRGTALHTVYETMALQGQLRGRGTGMSDQLLREARAWIADCTWADDIDAYSLTGDQVRRGVQRHYEGGWAAFAADCTPLAQ